MLLAVAAAVLLVLLVDGRELANPLLIVVLSASALAGLGACDWAPGRGVTPPWTSGRRGEMAARAKQPELDKAESEAELEKIKGRLEAQRTEITRERQLRLRTERARQAEREWSRELRDQVVNMYRGRGPERRRARAAAGDCHSALRR